MPRESPKVPREGPKMPREAKEPKRASKITCIKPARTEQNRTEQNRAETEQTKQNRNNTEQTDSSTLRRHGPDQEKLTGTHRASIKGLIKGGLYDGRVCHPMRHCKKRLEHNKAEQNKAEQNKTKQFLDTSVLDPKCLYIFVPNHKMCNFELDNPVSKTARLRLRRTRK